MITAFADPFDTLFQIQSALQAREASNWLQNHTTSQGPFPPINVFQQGGDILAIIELPGTGESGVPASSTARFPFPSRSTSMPSRPNTGTGS